MSFFRRNKEKIIITLVTIALIILIGITASRKLEQSKFESFLGNILTPITKVTNTLSEKTSSFIGYIGSFSKVRKENEALRNLVLKLEEENRNYQNIIGKTDFLKNEADLLASTEYNLIEAQITGKEPGNWYHRFDIDKGTRDGIKIGDSVVQGIKLDQNTVIEGIVGRVIDVGSNWSKVITIIDEQNKISFKILRTQDGGIINGSIDGIISGYLFDDKADVIKGDKLFTSGLGGGFIKDIYIGEIEDISSGEEEMVKTIKINPAIDFKKIYKVFIISN